MPSDATEHRPAAARRLMVCADDYAITPGVSRGIRELLTARRISATSVMAASRYWPLEAEALKGVSANADIGLHITLTDQIPLGPMPAFARDGRFPSMNKVLRAGLLRRLPLDEIRVEIERQYAAFVEHFGRPPAHIDGHHHVQQLPGVREIALQLAARVGTAWLRNGWEPPRNIKRRGIAVPKAMLIGALGRAVRKRALAASLPTNAGFSGVYDVINETRPLDGLFRQFVAGAGDRALVMCHPGYSDATLAALDVMTTARDREQRFFLSDAWPAQVAAADLEILPFNAAAG